MSRSRRPRNPPETSRPARRTSRLPMPPSDRVPNVKAWDDLRELEEVVRALRAGLEPAARRRVKWR